MSNSNVAIVANPDISPTDDPDSTISKVYAQILDSFESGKKAIILPCFSVGLVFDILECFAAQRNLNLISRHSLPQIQHYFISPVAKDSLTIASNLPEWLSDQRSERIHFGINQCFNFSKMLEDGSLKCCNNITGN